MMMQFGHFQVLCQVAFFSNSHIGNWVEFTFAYEIGISNAISIIKG